MSFYNLNKIEVSYFNLNSICLNPTIIINAKRGSGKSTMVRELMDYFNSTIIAGLLYLRAGIGIVIMFLLKAKRKTL